MIQINIFRIALITCFANLLSGNSFAADIERPLIFPIPLEVKVNEGRYIIDKSTIILLPEKPTKADEFLAELLSNELIDKYQQQVNRVRKSSYPIKGKCLLIGDISNPLVRSYCEQNGLV